MTGRLEPVSLAARLQQINRHLERLWGYSVNITIEPQNASLPAPLYFALRQIIIESVANSVMHGSAQTVNVVIQLLARKVQLRISDDGQGPADLEGEHRAADLVTRGIITPVTIARRVDNLGGIMRSTNSSEGISLEIELPVRRVDGGVHV